MQVLVIAVLLKIIMKRRFSIIQACLNFAVIFVDINLIIIAVKHTTDSYSCMGII